MCGQSLCLEHATDDSGLEFIEEQENEQSESIESDRQKSTVRAFTDEKSEDKPISVDSLVIRDATEQEKEELAIIAKEAVANAQMTQVQGSQDAMMTPRGSEYLTGQPAENGDDAGYSTYRSSRSIQLTGIKPKALIFESPVKSPVKQNPASKPIPTPSTKNQTASGSGQAIGSGFGGIKLMTCQGGGSPVADFDATASDAVGGLRKV